MASEWVTKEDDGITDDDYCDNVFKIKGNILLQCLEPQMTQRRRKLLLASNEKLSKKCDKSKLVLISENVLQMTFELLLELLSQW